MVMGMLGYTRPIHLTLEELEQKVEERQRFYPSAPSISDGTFDIVLTNPPFGARDRQAHILSHSEIGKGVSEKRRIS